MKMVSYSLKAFAEWIVTTGLATLNAATVTGPTSLIFEFPFQGLTTWFFGTCEHFVCYTCGH